MLCANDATMAELWYSALRAIAGRNVAREHLVPRIEISDFAQEGKTTFYTIKTAFPKKHVGSGASKKNEDASSEQRTSFNEAELGLRLVESISDLVVCFASQCPCQRVQVS